MKKGHISPEYKRRAKHRLKIIQGQIRGLEKLVELEIYCIEVLHQSLAIQESLKSFDALMLENHLRVHKIKRNDKSSQNKAINELLQLFRLREKNS